MGEGTEYQPIEPGTLGARLKDVDAVVQRVGADWANWQVQEVGDGNLNLVFIVSGSAGTVIVKQALPYVRLVGDSWPLTLRRAFFEYQALTRQQARDSGSVPQLYHFDEAQALIVMEYLQPHIILRKKLIAGERVDGLAERLGVFCARTAFRGSDLSMSTAERKNDVALFAGNIEIMAITEALVFCDPYFEAELNNHTEGLDPVVKTLRDDVAMKVEAQHLFAKFASNAETMLHGDLHSGSIMCTERETKVIDPEFVMYGPMGFDLGMMNANFLMAYFSQSAHRSADELTDYQDWILGVIDEVWSVYRQEFARLWASERNGMLYPRYMFEDQGHSSDAARDAVLAAIWEDAQGFCGIEMHRRVLSLAHNADFEEIEDTSVRAPLEARNLMMGRDLIKNRASVPDSAALLAMARRYNSEDVL
ncbi:MAG: S-methyl-5-thioribose kinase [Pseudomonadota bacterium]